MSTILHEVKNIKNILKPCAKDPHATICSKFVSFRFEGFLHDVFSFSMSLQYFCHCLTYVIYVHRKPNLHMCSFNISLSWKSCAVLCFLIIFILKCVSIFYLYSNMVLGMWRHIYWQGGICGRKKLE